MGYPNFGKVKTIVIPVPKTEMSIEEYKNTYGVDLRDILSLNPSIGAIYLKPNAFYLIDWNTTVGTSLIERESDVGFGLISIGKFGQELYKSGERGGSLTIGDPSGTYNLEIGIASGFEFSFENMYIRFNEI